MDNNKNNMTVVSKKYPVRRVADLYALLGKASYARLGDEDKLRLWRTARQLRPVAATFIADCRDAAERLLPDKDFRRRLKAARDYEQKNDGDSGMTEDEYQAFLAELSQYNELVGKAVADLADEEVDIAVYPLSDDAIARLVTSNDWTLEQAGIIEDMLREEGRDTSELHPANSNNN